MTLDIFKEKGTPLDKQLFTWRELVQAPTSKLDDDAFTRVRIILMNGLEADAIRTSHAMARMMNGDMRLPLAKIRRVEQHQQTMVNWLLPADLSPLETTIGFEQVAIEVTASVAQHEPDDYLANPAGADRLPESSSVCTRNTEQRGRFASLGHAVHAQRR